MTVERRNEVEITSLKWPGSWERKEPEKCGNPEDEPIRRFPTIIRHRRTGYLKKRCAMRKPGRRPTSARKGETLLEEERHLSKG